MAESIDNCTNDATYDAVLSGTYTLDAANATLTLGSDGEADTNFVLPASSEWVLVEVYDVEDVCGDIGVTRFSSSSSDTSDVATFIASVRTEALAEYTLFKITATHYHGDNTADVYLGDESNAATLHLSDTAYTPPVTDWTLSYNLVSPTHKSVVCSESYCCDVEWICS